MSAPDHLLCVPPSLGALIFDLPQLFHHYPRNSVGASGAMLEFIEVIVPGVWSAALWTQEVPASG